MLGLAEPHLCPPAAASIVMWLKLQLTRESGCPSKSLGIRGTGCSSCRRS